MAYRKIVKLGEEILRKKSRPVEDFGEKLHILLDDMAETMYKADGCGLAAPQIGLLRRVIVCDYGKGLVEMVNPEILEASGKIGGQEGCLSVPNKRGYVERYDTLRVSWQTRDGVKKVKTFKGFEAVVLQHEIDHLDGVLYIDREIKEEESK